MKTIKLLLITIVVLLCSATASAYDFEVDGIYYNITSITDLTVEVTNGDNEYSDKVIIPETVVYKSKVLKVTSISRYAFNGCKNLISVVIGNNVTSIIDETFSQCSNLTSVVIGNSVTSIGESAFNRCSNLTNVVIGNSVTSIGVGAFNYCEGLTNIEIPNSVTSIGQAAFSCCFSLTSIAIGNSVTSIGKYAFNYCTELTSIKIPNSVTSIGDDAFDYCRSLKELCIEDGIETLSLGCKEFYRYGDGTYYYGLFYDCPLETLYLGRNLSHSSYYLPFEQNKTLTSVTIGNSVTSIGKSAFYECSGLTSIEIPNSVTNIGEDAFYGCSRLTSIEIPNSVTNIGENAFYGCSRLTSIEIPNSVTRIGDGAFSFCSGIEKIEFKCAKIGTWFNGLFIKEVEIDYRVTSIAGGAFKDCSSLTNIHLLGETPPSVESNTFAESQYATLTIYVPQGSLSTYQSSDVWKNFWDIKEFYIDKYFYIRYFVDNVLFETDSIKHGAEIKLLDEPTKEGYTFSGWSEAPETMPANDITVEGTFCVNYYTATFIIDGEIYETSTVEYGAEIELPIVPEKEGYEFSGWKNVPKKMPANDIIVEGSYIADTAIEHIFLYPEKNEVYNAQGLRITDTRNLIRGIYIINDKKIFVK